VATESKFTKSRSNAGTEREGLGLLLADSRFQVPNLATKRRILELIGKTESFGIQTFDAVMTPEPVGPVVPESVEGIFPDLRLIEMKTTRKPIRNDSLHGFFFGATEREYEMARTLGDRYLFAFIVLTSANEYGRPFAVLLTLDEVERRTQKRRIQYQVNFRNDLTSIGGAGEGWLVLLGDETHLPIEPLET
jgi:hypothetical protein